MGNRASLNHVYRTIWNQSLGAMVAVAEIAPSQGGGSAPASGYLQPLPTPQDVIARIGTLALSIALVWGVTAPVVQANPTGAAAIVGSANLATQGNKLTVTTQNGVGLQHSAINWQSFSVPAGNTTHFQQPSAASTVINRVVTNVPSQLFGTLSSNGHLVLVNQAGIAVGAGALVDTAGFTASALRMTDADALAGRLRFGDATVSTAGVSVQGRILARSGDAVLIGSNVDVGQDALIQSPNGSTLLAAGQQVEITGRGLEGISFQLQAPTDQALNLGKLSGNAVGIFAGTLKHSGQIRADAVTVEGGKVVLKASRQLDVAGQVSAQALNQRGGTIQATAPEVLVRASALLDASGAAGSGELLVGGGYQGKDARLSNAQTTTVEMGAQLRADATTQGDGGTVIVWADDTTRVHGSVSARGGPQGGDGGFVETSGKRLLEVTQAADASAPLGKGGTWLLDPYDITIGASGPGTLVNGIPQTFTSSISSSSISATTIVTALNAGTSVTISTGFGGAGAGDITVASPITKAGGGDATLTLTAHNDINLNANISSTSNKLNLVMNADSDNSGYGGTVLDNATVSLNGGAFTATSNGGRVLSSPTSAFTLNNAIASMGTLTLSAQSGTLNLNAATSVSALNLSGGTLGGFGAVSVTNSFTQTDGVVNKTGSLTINQASGNLALGTITAGSLTSVVAAGALTTTGVVSGGDVALSGATGLTLADNVTASGTLSLSAATSGGINQSGGVISATGVTTVTAGLAGAVTLNQSGNNFSSVTVTAAGSAVTLRDTDALELGAIAAGSLTVNAGGSITQSSASSVSGASSFTATGDGDIALTNASNDFNSVSLTASSGYGGAVSVVDTSALTVTTLAAGANKAVSLVAAGALTTTGAISGGDVALSGATGLALAANVTANGTLSLSAATSGGINQYVGVISATGVTTVTSGYAGVVTLNQIGNNFSSVTGIAAGSAVTLRDTDALELGAIAAGSLTVNAGGSITQTSASSVSGASSFTATGDGDIALTNTSNDFNSVSLTASSGYGGAVSVVDTNALTVTTLAAGANKAVSLVAGGTLSLPASAINTGSANLTLSSGGSLTTSKALSGSNVSLSGASGLILENDVTATGTLSLSAAISGGITQSSGAVSAIGITTVQAGGAGAVSLNQANNNFTSVAVNAAGSAVSVTDIGPVVLGTTVAGSLTVNAGGTISQTGAIAVTGASAFTATDSGDITLNNAANNFNSLSLTADSANGGAISVTNENALTINSIVANGDITITAGGNMVLAGLVSAPLGEFGGTVQLTATAGAITKTRLAVDLDVEGKSIHLTAATGIGTSALPIKVYEDSGPGLTASLHFSNTTSSGVFISSDQDLHVDEGSNAGGPITLASNADLVINGELTASGLISLSTAGEMVVNADQSSTVASLAVTANKFTLNAGTWLQVSESLPAFNVSDFRIAGGTFIRALGGDGAVGTPYRLTDVYGLQGVGSLGMLDQSYVLANNIDASGTSSWRSGSGFVPIGGATFFTGTVNGGGHTIGRLKVNGGDNAGLFGTVGYGGQVKNLGLIDPQVNGGNNVGAMAGRNDGLISGSFVLRTELGVAPGHVQGSGYAVGGLVGRNDGPAPGEAPPIAGRVVDSYAMLPVIGAGDVGGLVGYNAGATVETSYAAGVVSLIPGQTGAVGGLVGYGGYGGTVTSSFWNTDSSFQAQSDGGAGLNSAEMKQLVPYAGWSISGSGGSSSIWRIYDGQTAPLLRSFLTPLDVTAGNGTRVYDGTTDFAGSLSYSQTPDPTGVLGAPSYVISSKNVGTQVVTPAGLYSHQLGYDIRAVGGQAVVTPRALSVSYSGVNKIYDGSTTASVTTSDNRITNDVLSINRTASFADKNAGSGKTVNVSAVSLSGVDAQNYSVAASGSTTADISKADLTVSSAAVIKTYDGGLSAAGTAQVTAGTLYSTDTLSGGSFAFTDKNAGANKTVTAAGVTLNDGNSGGNYNLSYANNTASSISAKVLNLSGSRSYDGMAQVEASVLALDGLVGQEILALSGTGTVASKNAVLNQALTLGSLALADAGAGATAGLASNYTFVGGTKVASITKADLTVSSTPVIKTYDGGLSAAGTAQVTAGTLYSTDTLSGGSFAFTDKNAGANKTVTAAGVTLNDGNSGGNYNLSYANNTASSISQAALTVSYSGVNKTYDGSTAASVTTSDNRITNDVLSINRTASFTDKNAAEAKTVSVSGVSLVGTDAQNYTVAASGSTTANIDKAALTVSYSGVNKTYDGSTAASVTTSDNRITNDVLSINRTASFTDKNAGEAKTVNVSGVSLVGTDAQNYTVAASGNTTADIAKAALSATANAAGKTYDGNATASVSLSGLSGLVGTETLGVSAAGSFDTKNAGTGKTVTVNSVALQDGANGGLASNYQLASGQTATADIVRATLSVSGSTAADKTYDGTSTAVITAGTLSGFIGAEKVSASASGNFDSKNAGTRTATAIYNLGDDSVTGGLAGNYTLSDNSLLSATISPKALSATANAAAKTYDGNATASVSLSGLSGLVGTETLGVSAAGSFNTKNAGTGKTVTVNSVALQDGANGGLASNYQLASGQTATADIARATLSVSGSTAADKTYDGTSTAVITAGTLSGFIGAEKVSASASGNFDSKNAGARTATAIYNLGDDSVTGGLAGNYTLSDNSLLSATISPKALGVSGSTAADKTYDGTSTAVITAGTLSGFIGAEKVSASASGNFDSKNAGARTTTAIYNLGDDSVTGGLAGNYTLSDNSLLSAIIIPKALSVSGSSAADKTYDGTSTAAIATGTLSGFIGSEKVSASASGNFDSKNAGARTATATYSLGDDSVTGGLAGNYTLSDNSLLSATIAQRGLSTWIAGATGAWSNPANWDAIPDRANVLDVSIPAGVTVQFDSDAGVTQLRSLTSAGALNLTGGSLAVANSLTTPSYIQTGGALSGTGALTVSTSFNQTGGSINLSGAADITQLTGNLNVGAISAAGIKLTAQNGAIRQTGALVTAGLLATQSAGSTVLNDAGNRVSAFTANSTGDLAFTNTGLLDVQGLLSSLGNIVINNTGGISSSGAVAAPSGAIALTANSPLTVGTAGVQALGDVNLTATDLTSAGNITLNGSVVSTSGSVTMAAANNLVQNSAISAALAVTGSAGLGGAGGSVSFGANATSDAKSISYLLNGLAVTAPPQLIKPVVLVEAPTNFVTSFLDVFEKALNEPLAVAAPAPAAKSSTADAEPAAKANAADAEATGEKTAEGAQEKAKEKEKEKEKEKTEVVIGGNACTPG